MRNYKLTLSLLAIIALTLPGKAEKLLLPVNPFPAKSLLASPKATSDKSSAIKQVVKLNLFQLPLLNFALQYECAFHKNMSGALGFSYLLPRDVPSQLVDPNSTSFQIPRFHGWSLTPEFRFYPGKKEEHQAPHGFYMAPYFRYAKYTVNAGYQNVLDSSGVKRSYDLNASYKGHSIGLMLGSQWIIGDHFSIDWFILGVGGGRAKFDIEAVSDGSIYMTDQQQADLKSDINDNIGNLGALGDGVVDITTTPTSAKVVVSGIPMFSVRFGVNLGFAF
jgi:hypothetical protein